MTVKLTLLDRQNSLNYSTVVDVFYSGDTYDLIGSCRLYRDDNGNHFGELNLNRDVSPKLYFYYRSRANNDGVFWFDGLDLSERELRNNRTTTLGEMIIR